MKFLILLLSLDLAGSPFAWYSNHGIFISHPRKTSSCNQPSSSVQCSGKTKAGKRCGNRTRNQSGYCHMHGNQASLSGNAAASIAQPVQELQGETHVRCSGLTKAGARCKRTTKNTNGRCYQHQRQ